MQDIISEPLLKGQEDTVSWLFFGSGWDSNRGSLVLEATALPTPKLSVNWHSLNLVWALNHEKTTTLFEVRKMTLDAKFIVQAFFNDARHLSARTLLFRDTEIFKFHAFLG